MAVLLAVLAMCSLLLPNCAASTSVCPSRCALLKTPDWFLSATNEPRRICLAPRGVNDKSGRRMCLTRISTEFVDESISWDVQAAFSFIGAKSSEGQGYLKRANDGKMLIAVSASNNEEHETNTEYSVNVQDSNDIEETTYWHYDSSEGVLFFKDDRGNRQCLIASEGFVAIASCDSRQAKDGAKIKMVQGFYGEGLCRNRMVERLFKSLTGDDGPYFWRENWDLCIGNRIIYDPNDGKKTIHMKHLDGYPYPLWQFINLCRMECEKRTWCHTFQVAMDKRTCGLFEVGDGTGIESLQGRLREDAKVLVLTQNPSYSQQDITLSIETD